MLACPACRRCRVCVIPVQRRAISAQSVRKDRAVVQTCRARLSISNNSNNTVLACHQRRVLRS